MNSPTIDGKIGTIAFLNAWWTVAWAFVRPFVLARSIYSLVKTSVNSALVNLAYPAIEPNDKQITAGSIDLNIDHEKYFVPGFIVIGNQPHLKHIKYWIIKAVTKDGTEITSITKVLMVWSCHLFFFKAAKIPNPIPRGIAKIEEYTLIKIVGGNFEINTSHTGLFLYSARFTPTPKSPWKTLLT